MAKISDLWREEILWGEYGDSTDARLLLGRAMSDKMATLRIENQPGHFAGINLDTKNCCLLRDLLTELPEDE